MPAFLSFGINDGVDKPYEVISMVLLEEILFHCINIIIIFSN